MQHLGLIVFILLATGLGLTVTKLPGGLSRTFSQRVANHTRAEILYSLLFVGALPLLYLFFAMWFVPTNSLPQSFLLFAAIAVIFQIICTWIPERGGKMTTIHRTLTGISGVALLPMIVLIATESSIWSLIRYAAWIALALMAALLTIALINQNGFRYALLLQIGYYALFFTIILLVTYTS